MHLSDPSCRILGIVDHISLFLPSGYVLNLSATYPLSVLQVRDVLPKHGFALGTLTKIGPDHTDVHTLFEDDGCSHSFVGNPVERCLTSAGRGWQAKWFRQQQGIVRYNCADSLDRTNVASFFGAIQVC